MKVSIEQAIATVTAASSVTFLTGAGVSTPSGRVLHGQRVPELGGQGLTGWEQGMFPWPRVTLAPGHEG